jgi:hypothetical protein
MIPTLLTATSVFIIAFIAAPPVDIDEDFDLLMKQREMAKMVVLSAMMILILASTISAKEQLSTKECEDLGFSGLALCSDCHSLSEYVKDQELVSDCLKCCADDSEDSMSKVTYSGAILEVCMRKLVFYPEIVGFIEEEKEKFPSVKVQYIFNSPPKLIMLDEDGEHKESIRIDNWKREHLLQYMREKVKPTAAS